MTEQMHRRGLRWAKVSGERGRWAVALGWRGEFQTSNVRRTDSKLHANIIARNWLNDQTENDMRIAREKDAAERAEDIATRKLLGDEAWARIPPRNNYRNH